MKMSALLVLALSMLLGCSASTPYLVWWEEFNPVLLPYATAIPIGNNLGMCISQDGKIEIYGGGDTFVDATDPMPGDRYAFSIGTGEFVLEVIEMDVSPDRAEKEYGRDVSRDGLHRKRRIQAYGALNIITLKEPLPQVTM